MLKILYVEDNPDILPNPYLKTLIDAIKKTGNGQILCDWGKEVFWSEKLFHYDIVHIMWPQFILMNHSSEALHQRLNLCRSKKIRIVSTCHNLVPHYDSNSDNVAAYEVVYNSSDMILHLGQFSLDLFQLKFSSAKNVLLPHHIYDERYNSDIAPTDARKQLHLDRDKKYILAFGAFRDEKERQLVIGLAKDLCMENVFIIAPQLLTYTSKKKPLGYLKCFFKINRLKRLVPNLLILGRSIPDNQVSLYFKASDIVLIQRTKILNSGNLPMAFFMGKTVIGPMIGNVGQILTATGNITFDPHDVKDLNDLIFKAMLAEKNGQGEKNKEYAHKFWGSTKIAIQLIQFYNLIIRNDA